MAACALAYRVKWSGSSIAHAVVIERMGSSRGSVTCFKHIHLSEPQVSQESSFGAAASHSLPCLWLLRRHMPAAVRFAHALCTCYVIQLACCPWVRIVQVYSATSTLALVFPLPFLRPVHVECLLQQRESQAQAVHFTPGLSLPQLPLAAAKLAAVPVTAHCWLLPAA